MHNSKLNQSTFQGIFAPSSSSVLEYTKVFLSMWINYSIARFMENKTSCRINSSLSII